MVGASERRDRGAVDTSLQMLFAMMMVLFAFVLTFEAVTYWHTRNVVDEAAAEGARVAALYGSSCPQGVTAARSMLSRHAGRWARGAVVRCTAADTVTLTITVTSPGVAGSLGFQVRVTSSVPRER